MESIQSMQNITVADDVKSGAKGLWRRVFLASVSKPPGLVMMTDSGRGGSPNNFLPHCYNGWTPLQPVFYDVRHLFSQLGYDVTRWLASALWRRLIIGGRGERRIATWRGPGSKPGLKTS